MAMGSPFCFIRERVRVVTFEDLPMCFPPVRGSGEEKKKRLQPIRTKGAPFLSVLCLRPSDSKQNLDRKSTRLNSSHVKISYADFCLKKKWLYCFTGVIRTV